MFKNLFLIWHILFTPSQELRRKFKIYSDSSRKPTSKSSILLSFKFNQPVKDQFAVFENVTKNVMYKLACIKLIS